MITPGTVGMALKLPRNTFIPTNPTTQITIPLQNIFERINRNSSGNRKKEAAIPNSMEVWPKNICNPGVK